jgi:hypothetical protein
MTEFAQIVAEYFEPVSAHRGYEMKVHPAADALPMLDDDAAASLLEDIKAHGLRERIKIWIDQERETLWLVDGRNRTRAAAAAGLYVRSVIEWKMFEDDAEVARFVFSLNLERRHLSTSQRAMAGARLLPMFEEAARARQGARSDLTSAQICTEVRVHRASRRGGRGRAQHLGAERGQRQESPQRCAGACAARGRWAVVGVGGGGAGERG